MKVDELFHNVFSANVRYNPLITDVYCRNCGTKLKVYYAESRLYAVKCGYCDTITLVMADSPMEAAFYVGECKEKERKSNIVCIPIR